MELINWDLLANPYNWVVVALMLYIAAYAFHLLAVSTEQMQFPLGL
jgi:ABC-type arginine/histidine transport system permease subunit